MQQPGPDPRKVGEIIGEHLADRKARGEPGSYAWLAAALTEYENRARPYQPSNVGHWIKGAQFTTPPQRSTCRQRSTLTPTSCRG